MGRADALIAQSEEVAAENVAAEIEEMSLRPDDIPKETWDLIQENGRIATERLYDILSSPRFMRLRAGEQAKLIALAQNRAYGMPKSNNAAANSKRRGMSGDVTASELRRLADRTVLPEYARMGLMKDVEDAEITN